MANKMINRIYSVMIIIFPGTEKSLQLNCGQYISSLKSIGRLYMTSHISREKSG